MTTLKAMRIRSFNCAAIVIVGLAAMIAGTTAPAHAQTYSVLYNFTYGADGGHPTAPLVQDSAGNFYGTTEAGGNLSCTIFDPGCGVVFKLSPTGQETVLYTFNGGTDGADPVGGLVLDAQGNLYGTTARGGEPNCAWGQGLGCGTIFKISTSGKKAILYRFKGTTDGASPVTSLYRDATGNLWGTAEFEGTAGCGTLYKFAPNGTLTVHDWQCSPNDGSSPLGALIADSSGNLYGTTYQGGPYDSGIIYKVDAAGKITILYSFDINNGGGAGPTGLLLAGNKLYGPTTSGGSQDGGTVYALSHGQASLLYNFPTLNDSLNPMAQGVLARDNAGNLYGTTLYDGEGTGTVYKVAPDGSYTVVYAFFDGGTPASGVIRDSAGSLYGTAQFAGVTGGGVVFKITPRE